MDYGQNIFCFLRLSVFHHHVPCSDRCPRRLANLFFHSFSPGRPLRRVFFYVHGYIFIRKQGKK